jgi:nucleoid-associated protein YgaU
MFATRVWIFFCAAAIVLAGTLAHARSSQGASRETRHVVRPGETLWAIAVERYGGDPRKAVWRIEERNGLSGAEIAPGTMLVLPP